MSWVVFSYSLPSKGRSSPRVAVWRRLRALGAVSPKGGVHVLPARDECVEAFQWLAQEVEQAKGEALLMRVERFEGLSDAHLIALFQEARKEDYAALDARTAALEKTLTGSRRRDPRDDAQARELLAKLRREHGEIARIDFFRSPAGSQAASRLARIEEALAPGRPDGAQVTPATLSAYRNKHWVTRPSPHVDRLACAWLIRRFINPRAVIRYSDAPLGGGKEKGAPESRQARPLQLDWGTQPFEPAEYVIGKEDQLKEGFIATAVWHRNLVERIGSLEFADDQFGLGPIVVELPHGEWAPRQVGHQHLVRVALQLEQMELCRRLVWHGASDDDKPGRLRHP